jgi:hypothetical protein
MKEVARRLGLDAKQMYMAEEGAGPNDIPEIWVVNGALVVGAGVALIWIVWRSWTAPRGRRLLSDEQRSGPAKGDDRSVR